MFFFWAGQHLSITFLRLYYVLDVACRLIVLANVSVDTLLIYDYIHSPHFSSSFSCFCPLNSSFLHVQDRRHLPSVRSANENTELRRKIKHAKDDFGEIRDISAFLS